MAGSRKKKSDRELKGTDRGRRMAACLLLLCIMVSSLTAGCMSSRNKGAGESGTASLEETAADSTELSGTELAESKETEQETTVTAVTAEMEEETAAQSVKEWLAADDESRDAWIVSFGALNVRRFCYAHGTVIGSFASGQKITVTGPASYGFYPVSGTDAETGEQIRGYCSVDYVSFMEYTGPAVRLDVVKYKQTDERWGEMKLGNSRYTLAQVGCTTTCFAMCESYLTGTEITPDRMAEQLIYSNEGNLYWPEEYRQDYGSDYLIKIYQKLHQGIPVLIGAKRKNGSQHWVLVTGYDPGDKEITKSSQLKSSDFIINDPGSGRNTLAEFFRDLPYFIKIAYYTGETE